MRIPPTPTRNRISPQAQKNKTPLRTLKQLLQELEESDYSGYGMWGNFEREDREIGRAEEAKFEVPRFPTDNDGTHQGDKPIAKFESQPSSGLDPTSNPYSQQEETQISEKNDEQLESDQGDKEALVGGLEQHQMDDDESRLDVDVSKALITVSRLGMVLVVGMVLSYLSVVPKDAPWALYNMKYKQNMALVAATAAPNILFATVVFDPVHLSVHNFVKVFYRAFTRGYLTCLALQMLQATVYRLAILAWQTPQLVKAATSPEYDVGLFALPWVFKDLTREMPVELSPSPILVFGMEFVVDCLGAPLIEEAMKLWVLLKSGVLPVQGSQEAKYASVHTYLGYMLASAIGLKLADNLRRVCLYTGPWHHQKTFFAFARGVFPVHELCAALTAMQLAKRDILGKPGSWARMLLPAVLLHAMGNFRGKKPLFKWGSSSPWVEMQLQAWSTADDAPPAKVILNGCTGLFWLSILVRVLIHLCRRYYCITKEQRRLVRIERYTDWQSHTPN